MNFPAVTQNQQIQSRFSGLLFVFLLFFSFFSYAKEVQKVKESSCGSQAKPVYFNSSGAGLKDMQMALMDGEFGPEFQIGQTRFFFSPTDTATQPSGAGLNKVGSFRIINPPDPEPGAEKGKSISAFSYFNKGGQVNSNGMFPKEMKISANGETARIQYFEKRDAEGKVIDRYLLIKGDKNQSLRVDIDNKSKGQDKVDVKMSVKTLPIDGGCDLGDGGPKIGGIFETHVKGTKNSSGQGDDSFKVKGCKNQVTGTDHSENPSDNKPQRATVDLDGNDFILGKNKAPNNQFQCSQRVPRDQKKAQGTPVQPLGRSIAGNGRDN